MDIPFEEREFMRTTQANIAPFQLLEEVTVRSGEVADGVKMNLIISVDQNGWTIISGFLYVDHEIDPMDKVDMLTDPIQELSDRFGVPVFTCYDVAKPDEYHVIFGNKSVSKIYEVVEDLWG